MLSLRSKADFRSWLAKHHETEKQVWLAFYKKESGKQTLTPLDALEEAICYGWIDVQIRSINTEEYALRFVARRKGSTWSEHNKKVAVKLIQRGKMSRSGYAALPAELQKRRSGRGRST